MCVCNECIGVREEVPWVGVPKKCPLKWENVHIKKVKRRHNHNACFGHAIRSRSFPMPLGCMGIAKQSKERHGWFASRFSKPEFLCSKYVLEYSWGYVFHTYSLNFRFKICFRITPRVCIPHIFHEFYVRNTF